MQHCWSFNVEDGHGTKCLVIGADSMSKILDWMIDQQQFYLVTAGAVILENRDERNVLQNKISGEF